jgi:hypothetical protein
MSLFKESLSEHLTPAAHHRAAHVTHPGQAHFAGSGPEGRECWHWQNEGYQSRNGKWHGLMKPARCRKFQMLTRKVGDRIRDDAPSCRHFEARPIVPRRIGP